MFSTTETKKYFVTTYKKALDGSADKRVRRVRYIREYRVFGVKVWSKVLDTKKARNQKTLPLENAAAEQARRYQAAIQ